MPSVPSPRMRRCWSCAAEGPDEAQLCASCGVVHQPDPASSPFARLGLPVAYELADGDIERAWLLRSSKVHPDRFVKRSDRERRFAVEQTAALNDAKRAVKDPFDRASWLVAAAGIDASKLEQRLLVTLMEARERAEQGDAEKNGVIDESVARYRVLAASLPSLLLSLGDHAALEKAARALGEMKTLARLVLDLGGAKLIASLDGR